MKENQDNLCQLPGRIRNFVGREKEIEESREILSKDENFLIITGGPCYGKSSLATELGHSMFEDTYNYVVWINMRDIPSDPPSLEDTAQKILQEFTVDTISMKNDIVQFLINKFELITASGKTALLIFDNADDLIASEDVSCRSSTYTELSRLIRNNSRESIRAVFTTRVYNASDEDTLLHDMKLKILSDEESEEFIRLELMSKVGFDIETRINDIVGVSCGLPIALRMICSNVKQMDCKEMIEDYLNDLKQDPLENLNVERRLHKFFDLSLKHLGEKKEELQLLLSLLVVFPSRFSYKYMNKLSDVLKDGKVKPLLFNLLKTHSLIQDDFRVDDSNQEETSKNGFFNIHPFFRQYIRTKFWKEGKGKQYELAFYTLYTKELFILAKEALKKDNYIECLKEFEAEQHNFFYMMRQVGSGFEERNCTSFLKEDISKVLERETPDYIATSLFCIDITSPSLLLKFFESCEVLVAEGLKKSIWCCRYDLHMKYFDKEIDDLYKDLEPDVYGRALMEKRSIATKIYMSSRNKHVEGDFSHINGDLDALSKSISNLECSIMRAYFNHKIHKLKGSWLKKGQKFRGMKKDCIDAFKEALKICQESFGKNWLTIDCYNQLGKLFWQDGDRGQARLAFDNAIELAESMSLRNNKKFGSCLLDKGRFLIESGIEEEKEEGISLLESVLDRCKDFSDIRFQCRALGSLLKVDKSKIVEVRELFFKANNLCASALPLMEEAIKLDLNPSDVDMKEEDFLECEKEKLSILTDAITKLEKLWNLESSGETSVGNGSMALRKDVRKHLYQWQMRAALRYNHVLLLSKRKEFAEKALEILDSCSFINRDKKDELQTLVNFHCDPCDEGLLREMFYLNRISQRLPREAEDNELMQRYSKLIEQSEGNQILWSLIVSKVSRNTPIIYDKVTAFLLHQPEPCEGLLKLVRHKFDYQIKIYEREADERKIMEESKKAVDDLKMAFEYVEGLLLEKRNMKDDVITRLENNLWHWSKHVSLNAGHCLRRIDLVQYARHTLTMSHKLNDKEKKTLRAIERTKSPVDEQEKIRQKTLLVKVTKYMRAEGMQDELERRYEAFLRDCLSFPRVKFEMVKFILKFNNVECFKFGKYLQFLHRHFADGSLNTGWDYQFVVDIADSLFSNELDCSSQTENYNICKFIYDRLRDSQIALGVRKKLEFLFLAIFSLKIRSDVRDMRIRQEDAYRALDIFNDIGSNFRNELSSYKKQLEELIR